MLADPEVQGAPVWVSGEVRRRAGFGEERRRAVHRGVVGSGEVGRTAPQLGKYRSQSIEHLARSLTCGHLRAGIEGGQGVGPALRQLTGPQALQQLRALVFGRLPGGELLVPLYVGCGMASDDFTGVLDDVGVDVEVLIRVETEE